MYGRSNIDSGESFLQKQVDDGVDFIVLASSSANPSLFNIVRNLQIPVFFDTYFPGLEERENIAGAFVIPWEEGIQKGLSQDSRGSTLMFDAQLYWRKDVLFRSDSEKKEK